MKKLLSLLTCIVCPLLTSAAERPNILVIVSDDQGYADTGFQGCKDIPTPHLDRLARTGVRCTNGYVTHPFCSPTRAALMTGRYQQRFGHENNPFYDPADHREGLPTTEKLLPEFLRAAGYATGWIGKWHLGAAPEFHPEKRGFTETFGFIGGGHRYQDWKVNPKVEYLVPIERNGQPVEVTEHLTVAFGHEAAAFIRRHKSEPWFLYLAFNAPHTPHEPTPERLARFANIENQLRRNYAAQLSLLDDAIGETLTATRETGQENRTLVFFFSDNGGQTLAGAINTPLRGKKGDVWEGGIRVPFVVSWPGTLPAGGDYHSPVSSLDVFPTALTLAGVTLPTERSPDGVNLIPYLSGAEKSVPPRRLFWRSGGGKQIAMRDDNLKFIRRGNDPVELYNLADDVSESNNLAAARASDAQELGAEVDGWNKQLIPPAFPGAGGRAAKTKKKITAKDLVEP
jgi:arylsulfatase A-like enzyme